MNPEFKRRLANISEADVSPRHHYLKESPVSQIAPGAEADLVSRGNNGVMKTPPRGRQNHVLQSPSTPKQRNESLKRPHTPVQPSPMIVTPKKRKIGTMTPSSDRFIPMSQGSEKASTFAFLSSEHKTPTKPKKKHTPNGDADSTQKESASRQLYADILVHELLPEASPLRISQTHGVTPSNSKNAHSSPFVIRSSNTAKSTSLFAFRSPTHKRPEERNALISGSPSPLERQFSRTLLSQESRILLQTPKKLERTISKTPYKVLDAPELQDDFYLNLVDWGSNNMLGVGLGTCVYLWNASTSNVVKLCDLGPSDSISSVSWIQRGTHIAVGTNRGLVQIWDVRRSKKIRQFSGHQARVGSMAWNVDLLTTGSRDRQIYHRDVRSPNEYAMKLSAHKQEVCGLKWNFEETHLASGGNDNKLYVWDIRNDAPMYKFDQHTAAVKAIAWSPHQHGLLASGGGTADRHIRFWNTLTGTCLNSIDTGSQVCNLAWSKTSNEFVSTHGYSQNQIAVWKYPSLTQIATLTGHTYRVLYLAMSPDGQNVVTGAGDETLRFWSIFQKNRARTDSTQKMLTLR